MKISILRQSGNWLEPLRKVFEDLGHETQNILVDAAENSQINSILDQLRNFKPHFTVCENFHAFDFAYRDIAEPLESFLNEKHIPTAVWMVDSARGSGSIQNRERWRRGYWPEWKTFFCTDAHDALDLQVKGISSAHLPLGVDQSLEDFRPKSELVKKFEAPLSYSGRITLTPDLPPSDDETLKLFFIQNLSTILMLFIETEMRENFAFHTKVYDQIKLSIFKAVYNFFDLKVSTAAEYQEKLSGFYKIIESEIPLGLLKIPHQLEGAIHFHFSYAQLTHYLKEFFSLGLKVYGTENWKRFFGSRAEMARPLTEEELFHCFHASRINFNHTKWHFRNVVHERISLVLAARGFILTDKNDDLYKMFDEDEIASYSSLEEARSKIEYYLRHDTERLHMIEKARRRLFADHTLRHRAMTMIDCMRKTWGLTS